MHKGQVWKQCSETGSCGTCGLGLQHGFLTNLAVNQNLFSFSAMLRSFPATGLPRTLHASVTKDRIVTTVVTCPFRPKSEEQHRSMSPVTKRVVVKEVTDWSGKLENVTASNATVLLLREYRKRWLCVSHVTAWISFRPFRQTWVQQSNDPSTIHTVTTIATGGSAPPSTKL